MIDPQTKKDQKAILVFSYLTSFIAGFCCLAPILMVLFGVASISAAASFGNILYGGYRWVFRGFALVCLIVALVVYFRRQGVCTIDQAKRQRNRILNLTLMVLYTAVGMYIFWTYIVLHYLGIVVGLPWGQYDESWAIPASVVTLGGALLIIILRRRRLAKSSDKNIDTVEQPQKSGSVETGKVY
jgi:hypothetical protein